MGPRRIAKWNNFLLTLILMFGLGQKVSLKSSQQALLIFIAFFQKLNHYQRLREEKKKIQIIVGTIL